MPSLPLRRRQMMTKGEVISNPGRRLALCVAPYFADRGVGDMRGPPNGVPKNATPEAVAGRYRTTLPDEPPRDTQHVARITMVEATACHHLRGGDLGGTPPRLPRMSPRPRVAKYGATHGCNPSRGSENVRLRSSSPPLAVGRTLRCARRATMGRVVAASAESWRA